MIRYAKVLEIDDTQFLVRLCHHPALANIPGDSDKPCGLLTVDTVIPDAPLRPHLMRMIINCQTPHWQQLCFDVFNEADCLEVLAVLVRQKNGALSPADMMDAALHLQGSLLTRVGYST
jgi:hypothetical protein